MDGKSQISKRPLLVLLATLAAGCGLEAGPEATAEALAATAKGAVVLDAAAYRATSTVAITVLDANMTRSVSVNVASTTTPKGISVSLSPVAGAPGNFAGSAKLALARGGGALLVKDGDTVTVKYVDPNDGTGRQLTATATATVDNHSPDLALDPLYYASATRIAAGAYLDVRDTLRNLGPIATTSYTVVNFLLLSSPTDPSNRVIGSRTVGFLDAGGSSTGTTSVRIPGSLNGTFYVGAQIVANEPEFNPKNDRVVGPAIQVLGPDLALASLSYDTAPVYAGGQIAVSDCVVNNGPGAVDNNGTPVWYSLTSAAGDVTLGYRMEGAFAVGAVDCATSTFALPASLAGTYAIRAVVDPQQLYSQEIDAANDANNALVGPTFLVIGP
jgi:hypothetical protein